MSSKQSTSSFITPPFRTELEQRKRETKARLHGEMNRFVDSLFDLFTGEFNRKLEEAIDQLSSADILRSKTAAADQGKIPYEDHSYCPTVKQGKKSQPIEPEIEVVQFCDTNKTNPNTTNSTISASTERQNKVIASIVQNSFQSSQSTITVIPLGVDDDVEIVELAEDEDDDHQRPPPPTTTKRPRIEPPPKRRPPTKPKRTKVALRCKTIALKCTTPTCSQFFLTRSLLNNHLKNVHNLPSKECVLYRCNEPILEGSNICDHIAQVHGDLKEFVCGKCFGGFPDNQKLKAHYTRQHIEGQFKCLGKGCDMIFNFRSQLDVHFKMIHEISDK